MAPSKILDHCVINTSLLLNLLKTNQNLIKVYVTESEHYLA